MPISTNQPCACACNDNRLLRETLDYGLPRPPLARRDGSILRSGQFLDGFRLRHLLGHGCTGRVYLADDLPLEREVAVKILLEGFAREPRVIKAFEREAVAMASLRHENVVPVYACGEHRGLPYFVMEYLPGGTVAALLESASARGEQLYLDVVLGIVSQIGRGLQALHAQGIVHNDVKPANMLIGPRFRVALADFGLAQLAETAEVTPELAGTPVYLAPELILGRPIPAAWRHRVDIYALGVTTFELLTGHAPFAGGSICDLFTCHLEQEPPRVSDLRDDLPLALDRVLRRAMAKDPAERYDSCTAFLADLTEIRAGAAPASRGRWMRSRPTATGVSCVGTTLTATTW